MAVTEVRGATSFVGDLFTLAGGRGAAALLSLVTVLFTTRILGPNGYGTIALAGVIISLTFTVTTAWTATAVRRYGREELEERGTMNRLTWNRAVIGAPLLAICCLLVVSLKAAGVLPAAMTWQVVALALGTAIIYGVMDHVMCLIETVGRMKVSALGQVGVQALYVLAVATLYAGGAHVSPQLILTLTLGEWFLFVVIAGPAVWRVGMIPVQVEWKLLRRMLMLSTPLIGLALCAYVVSAVDIVILRAFASNREVGIYAVAYQAYTVLSSAAVAATAVFVPLLVSLSLAGKEHLVTRYLARGVPQAFFMIGFGAAVIVPLLPLLVPVVFGKAFAGAADPLVVLFVALAAMFATNTLAPVLTLHERTRATALINVVVAMVNVVGDLVMLAVFHLGTIAPAIATAAAMLFMLVAFGVYARRLVPEAPYPDLLVAAPLAASIVPTLALGGLLGAVAGLAVGIGAAGAVLVWRRPFQREDAAIVNKLDIPPRIKRVLIGAISRVAPD